MPILACILSLLVTCSPTPTFDRRTPQPEKEPVLVVLHEEEPEDRGAVPVGAPVTRRVMLDNTSAGPVRLRVVGTSCPCTTASLASSQLQAGERTSLTLALTASEVNGRQTYTAEVEAAPLSPAGAKKQHIRVAISYMPDIEVQVLPRSVTIYASTRRPGTFDLYVRRFDSKEVEIDEVVLPGDWLRVKAILPNPGAPAQRIVRLESADTNDTDRLGMIEVRVRGEGDSHHRLPVRVRTDAILRAEPPALIFTEKHEKFVPARRTLSLHAHPEGAGSDRPATARLSEGATFASLGAVAERAPGLWEVEVKAIPTPAGAPPHGREVIELLDDSGRVLHRVPVLWFTERALRPAPPSKTPESELK